MGGPLDDIALLARSENRVDILQMLDESARDRRELESMIHASRSTLSRALGELEDQGWIEQDGRTYRTTTSGSIVIDRFTPLVETMDGLGTLGDLVDLLPLREMGLDVRHLADARVIEPAEFAPNRPFEYGVDRLREADEFRFAAHTSPKPYTEAIHEGATTGDLSVSGALDAAYFDTLSADRDAFGKWQEIAAQSSTVRRHEGPIPYTLLLLDDTVHLWVCDDDGEPPGILESDHPAVLSWAESTVEGYLDEARPLDPVLSN